MTNIDINKYIGNKIREFRTKKNITQEEIAEYLNTTSQTVSRYEIGDRKTNQDILYKLAEYFKVSINDFYPPINSTVNVSDTNKIKLILQDSNEFTEEHKKSLIDMIDCFHNLADNNNNK